MHLTRFTCHFVLSQIRCYEFSKELSRAEESVHSHRSPPSDLLSSSKPEPHAQQQLHNTWQTSARLTLSCLPHARTREHVRRSWLWTLGELHSKDTNCVRVKRSTRTATAAKTTASQRAASLPSLLSSSHQRLFFSERVHVHTHCPTKPVTDKASPAVQLGRCMENHRPASVAKAIDGAQPCCSECNEKMIMHKKGPAYSQPRRFQGSLINRLTRNSIPGIRLCIHTAHVLVAWDYMIWLQWCKLKRHNSSTYNDRSMMLIFLHSHAHNGAGLKQWDSRQWRHLTYLNNTEYCTLTDLIRNICCWVQFFFFLHVTSASFENTRGVKRRWVWWLLKGNHIVSTWFFWVFC